MSVNLPERTLREIRMFAEKRGIGRVILFGSRAKGTHTDLSDVDLAVVGGDAVGFWEDLNERAHTLLRFDVLSYNEGLTEALTAEIRENGRVLYEKT